MTLPWDKSIFLKKSEVERNRHLLNLVAFYGVRTLNGIRKVHHMEVSNVTSLGLLHFFKFLFDHFLIQFKSDLKLNEIILNISFLIASLQVVGASQVKVSGYQGASDSRIHTLK